MSRQSVTVFVPDDLASCRQTDLFGSYVASTHDDVLRLLHWLQGAPAGLKLNQPLSLALASFFSYHVNLWTLYLEIAVDVLWVIVWLFVWGGLWGLSFQVALLSDLVHLATLHLHCFYVYAARIHMVQVSLLGSQWRAFRGRKWNPLKNRVDSLYGIADGDGLEHRPLTRVLTAVVFTLAVFLLPTTTVYYLVFLLLRLCLYSVRGLLFAALWLINSNPLYIVMLHALQSSSIKGDVYLAACNSDTLRSLPYLQLRFVCCVSSVRDVLMYTASPLIMETPTPCFSYILNSILYARQLL